MPRKYLLSWDKTHKRWIKTIDGVKHYFEKADRKADLDAYKQSLEQYNQLIGISSPDVSPTSNIPTKIQNRKRYAGSYKHPATSMAGVVERYFAHHKSRFDAGIIAASTLTLKGYSLEYFIEKFVRTKAYKLNSIGLLNEQRFAGFNTHLRNRYKKGELSFYTAKTHQNNVSQMIKWAWRQRHLDDLPRNLNDPDLQWNLRVHNKPSSAIDVYSPGQIKAIFNQAYESERWCDFRIFILLGINCGFTPAEIGSLTFKDFTIENDNVFIERRRPKTGVKGRWILWSETIFWITRFFGDQWIENLGTDRVLFRSQTGRSLANAVITRSEDFISYNNIKSKTQSSISRRWTRLAKSVLEDPNDYLPFKYLRKTGATYLANMDINNATRISQTYLCHSLGSVADKHYLQHDFDNQNDALIQMGIDLGFHQPSA